MQYKLDIELDELILKYGIYDANEGLKKRLLAEKYIREDFSKKLPDECVIWGGGASTEIFLECLGDSINKIKYIVDNDSKEIGEVKGIKVFSPKKILQDNVDVIVVSYAYRYDILSDIHMMDRSSNVIDLYAYMEEEGLYFEKNFFDYYVTYENIHIDERVFRQNQRKQYWVKKLIGDYIFIRDFDDAFRLFNDCHVILDNVYDYSEFIDCVKELIFNVSNNISKQHIAMFWMDSIKYEESLNMPFLMSEAKSGVEFCNAISNGVHTRSAFKSLLSGELIFENNNLLKSYDEIWEKSILINELKSKGYGLAILSHYSKELARDDYIHQPIPAATQIMWGGVCRLSETDTPLLVILHMTTESHEPFYAADMDNMLPVRGGDTLIKCSSGENAGLQAIYLKQVEDGIQYLDRQIKWFSKLYSRNLRIYMSDHGKSESPFNFTSQARSVLVLNGRSIKKQCIEKIIEIKNYHKLIMILIDKNIDQIDSVLSEYAVVLEDDFYNRDRINKLVQLKADNYMRSYSQFRGIITLKDAYVEYATGKEIFYSRHNNAYVHDATIDTERKEFLRNKVNIDFINSYDYEQLSYCKKIYDYLGEKPVYLR